MWRRVDLVLRCVYVALVPIVLALLSQRMPVGGVLGAVVIGSVAPAIGARGRLGAFYEAEPPKPVIYYILYLALFPYWLLAKRARAEAALYRGFIAIALVIVTVSTISDYVRKWSPLPFGAFVGTGIVSLLVQMAVALAIVLPIVTTVVSLAQRGYKKTLWAVLVLGVLSIVAAIVVGAQSDAAPFDVRARIEARLEHDKKKSFQAFTEGLNAAYLWLRDHPGELDRAKDAAQRATQVFYRPDEARALELWSGDGILMLYTPLASGKYLWLARNDKRLLTTRDQLPDAARKVIAN